jgi:acetylxylan esterase
MPSVSSIPLSASDDPSVQSSIPQRKSTFILFKMLSIIFLAVLPLALAVPTTAPSGSCAQVGIITARASTETPGEGIIGTLAAAIQSSSTQTVSRTAVDYPAVLEPYAPSVASGVAVMTADLEAAVQACPDQKIVLLGYSQGGKHFCFKLVGCQSTNWHAAQCVGDTLGGGGGGTLDDAETPPVDFAAYGSHVVAGIMVS